jgi:hypothetical protein
VRVNGPDLDTIGINLSSRMRIVWRRGKANINRLLGNAPPGARITHESACRLPYELVEMIVAHIAHDLDALKAFSSTCRSWHTAAAPHLHHTLTLTNHGKLKSLSELHQLGLMSHIKEVRMEQKVTWFTPQAFNRRDLGYFSAFANVQTLMFQHLETSRLMPDIGRYFGHFSPTLQSIPHAHPTQLFLIRSSFRSPRQGCEGG